MASMFRWWGSSAEASLRAGSPHIVRQQQCERASPISFALIDAKRGEVFAQFFAAKQSSPAKAALGTGLEAGIAAAGEPLVAPAAEIAAAFRGRPILLWWSGAAAVRDAETRTGESFTSSPQPISNSMQDWRKIAMTRASAPNRFTFDQRMQSRSTDLQFRGFEANTSRRGGGLRSGLAVCLRFSYQSRNGNIENGLARLAMIWKFWRKPTFFIEPAGEGDLQALADIHAAGFSETWDEDDCGLAASRGMICPGGAP
ncbi:MAG: hypothetical protein R3D29_03835 [Nitratireductor sp.]